MRIKKARTIGRLVSRAGKGSGCIGMVGIDNFAIPDNYERFPRRLRISASCRGPARQIHVDRVRFVFVTSAREPAVAKALTQVRIRAELPGRWNLKNSLYQRIPTCMSDTPYPSEAIQR